MPQQVPLRDSVHELLGLQGEAWQVMYHFTVGDSIEGKRLQTHPPYAHIQDRVASTRSANRS
jgi:hypothetical protein